MKIKKIIEMRRLIILLTVIFASAIMTAQDIYAPSIDLTPDEKKTVSDGKSKVKKAERLMRNASADYVKYSPLFNSKRKSKQKKAEKKTLTGKRNMISAAGLYKKGYRLIFDLYVDKFNSGTFIFDDDRQKAEDLVHQAQAVFEDGEQMLTIKSTYDDKTLKKKIKFMSLKKKVEGGVEKEEEGLKYLVQALELLGNQQKKKQQQTQEDNNDWQSALATNTIDAYNAYLNKHPNGLHALEAKNKIDQLEQEIKIQEQKQQQPKLVYYVQILCDSVKPWTKEEIKNKVYRTNMTIREKFIDNCYKYWIGEFSTYDAALKVRDKVRRFGHGAARRAFVVGTLNGVPVSIEKAIEVEQSENKYDKF